MAADWQDGYYWSADGVRLHYRDQPGPQHMPPLLCIPGLTRNARDFEGLAKRLLGRTRVISVDLRGRGESGFAKDPMSYNPLTYLGDIDRLIAELALSRFVAVGTSLGGIVTMLLAGAGRVGIGGAILNDVGPELDQAGIARIRAYVGRGGSWPTWLHAARALAEAQGPIYPDHGLTDWLTMAKRIMRLDGAGRVIFDYDMKIAEPFRLPGGEAGIDLWPAFAALGQVPVLILRGQYSDLLPVSVAERMATRLPDARVVTVPRVGHAPTLDEPAAVAAIDALVEHVSAQSMSRVDHA